MRPSDFRNADRTLEGWIVPLDLISAWASGYPERMHQASRGERFLHVWRRLAYLRFWTHGAMIDDETAKAVWLALSLRDLRGAPEFPRMYREAEWEIVAELCDGTPPLNGEALYDQVPTDAPLLHYQFHGLPAARDAQDETYLFDEMLLGYAGRTLAGVRHSGAAGILASGNRPAHEDFLLLSNHLNVLRESRGLEPLEIGEGRQARSLIGAGLFGLLIETEDGGTITPAPILSA